MGADSGTLGAGGRGRVGVPEGPRWAVPLPEDPAHAPKPAQQEAGALLVPCSVPPRCVAHPGCRFGFGLRLREARAPSASPPRPTSAVLAHPWGKALGPRPERSAQPTSGPLQTAESPRRARGRQGRRWHPASPLRVPAAAGPPRAQCPSRAGQSRSRLGHPQRVPRGLSVLTRWEWHH